MQNFVDKLEYQIQNQFENFFLIPKLLADLITVHFKKKAVKLLARLHGNVCLVLTKS